MLGLDTDAARAVPGVVAVLTAADIPGGNQIGVIFPDQPLLVTDRVRMVGDRLALVAARTPEAAWAAARAVAPRLEPLPGVHDPVAALTPRAPTVHDSGNLVREFRVVRGDLEAERERAAVVVEAELRRRRPGPRLPRAPGLPRDPRGPRADHDRRLVPVPVLHPARGGAGARPAAGRGAGRAGPDRRRLRRQGGLPHRAGRMRRAARLAHRQAGAAAAIRASSTCRSPPSAMPRWCATAGAPTPTGACSSPRSTRCLTPAPTPGSRPWSPSAPTSPRSGPTTCPRSACSTQGRATPTTSSAAPSAASARPR